jgi:hypothetical protein
MRLCRDLTLIGGLLALTLLGGAQAQAARDPLTAPNLLWRTYPLVQDPFSPRYRLHATAVGGVPHPLPARIPEGGNGMSSPALLLLMLASLVAALAGVLLLRSPLANAGYGSNSTRPRRKRPRKPRADSSADMLVALKPSTASRPEPDEDLREALQPVAAEPASEGDEEPEEDEAATPVAREVAVDPTEVATERRTAEPRKLLPAPRQLDQPVQTGEIRLWHGYFRPSQLYASSGGATFALSDFFRLRDEDTPTEAALAELENLITRLEAKGWAVVDEGPRWYDVQIERAE